MHNHQIINYLIEKNNYKTYLEIGVRRGETFSKINIEHKESCDVNDTDWELDIPITYLMSSDEMFALMSIYKKYDIIFIDAMHSEEYLDRDIINSLKHLNHGGIILCHDILPPYNESTSELYNKQLWVGTCWKSVCKLQDQNIQFHTLNQLNMGLCIIKEHSNPYSLHYPYNRCTLNYDYVFRSPYIEDNFEQYIYEPCTEQGKYILHYITEEEFFKMY